jgi:hypothetical protein
LPDIVPEAATGPTNQGLFAEFATVHPLAAKVAPLANPPPPAGSINTVCAYAPVISESRNAIKNVIFFIKYY